VSGDRPHKTLGVNGTALAYFEAGSGPETVLFVHGSLDDYRSWRYQFGPFSERYRVIAYSRRYHHPNRWDGDGSDYSAELHAGDLAALIRSLAARPVHLVTSSYGGNVALLMTARNPELVRSLVLGEPPLMPWLENIPGGQPHLQRFLDHVWLPARDAFAQDRLEDGARSFLDGVMGRPTFKHLDHHAYQMIMDNAPEMAAETLANRYFPPFTCEDAAGLLQPVLLCKGERSPEVFHMITDELARCLSNAWPAPQGTAALVVIPGASHVMHSGNPQVYNKVVLDFLAAS
jgi:non-heme chloroperoxidase